MLISQKIARSIQEISFFVPSIKPDPARPENNLFRPENHAFGIKKSQICRALLRLLFLLSFKPYIS